MSTTTLTDDLHYWQQHHPRCIHLGSISGRCWYRPHGGPCTLFNCTPMKTMASIPDTRKPALAKRPPLPLLTLRAKESLQERQMLHDGHTVLRDKRP